MPPAVAVDVHGSQWSAWVTTGLHSSRGWRKGPCNFFVVFKGRRLGLYYRWCDVRAAVCGYPDARFEGYDTLQEAEAAFVYFLGSKGVSVNG